MAMSIIMLTIVKMFVIIFGVYIVAVYYYHKLKRRMELKERKIFEILKNQFGLLFYIFNDNFLLAMV